MNKDPLEIFADAIGSTAGGVVAFFGGLFWGSVIVFAQQVDASHDLSWLMVAWLVLIPYAIANVWGLLLVPFLGAMLVGLIWRDWNRLPSAAGIAVVYAGLVLLSAEHNPFDDPVSARNFSLTMGSAILILLVSLLGRRLTRRALRRAE